MAFRDDRDALAARADALERENRRLREEVEAHRRAADDHADDAAAREELSRRAAALEAELARARGPGLRARAGARLTRLWAAVQPGPIEGGYGRAALVAWRSYLPGLALFATAALIAQDGWIALAVPAFAAGGPALAALAALVPWVLGYRRRVVAGRAAGAGLALAGLGVLLLCLAHADGSAIAETVSLRTGLALGAGVVVAMIALRVLGVPGEDNVWVGASLLPVALMLPPMTVLLGLIVVGYVASWTGRLADRR
jgi:hypothetical protein